MALHKTTIAAIINENTSRFYIDSVWFTFSKNTDKWLQIERVFIEPADRKKGFLSKALKQITDMADQHELRLSCSLLPDKKSDYDRLRTLFVNNGFTLVEMDGEVYRNDLDRLPKLKTSQK